MMQADENIAVVYWSINPFRGDKFEDAWRPSARAALDYGATSWMLFRSQDDPLAFIQMASFPNKKDFDRYWFSEEISEARADASGYYQVPVIPKWLRVVDSGELARIES
jgi:hypothetical protein